MKFIYFVAIAQALMVGQASAQEPTADLTQAKEKYANVCKNCHGPTGAGMASFPKLAGRDADYIAKRLNQYRAGEKVGPNTALMKPHAVDLTDEDIANLAAYISKEFN